MSCVTEGSVTMQIIQETVATLQVGEPVVLDAPMSQAMGAVHP